jgi:hypothetical protein
MSAATAVIDNATGQIVNTEITLEQSHSCAQRFRDWYLPHAEEIVCRWKMNYPGAAMPKIDEYLMTGRAP